MSFPLNALTSLFILICATFQSFGQQDTLMAKIDEANERAWNKVESDVIEAYDLAYHAHLQSLEINYLKGLAKSNKVLGLIYLINGDLEQALSKTLTALNQNDNSREEAVILNQIGRIYLELKNFKKAQDAFEKSKAINQRNRDPNLVSNLINFGNLKKEIFQIDSAFYYYDEALHIAKQIDDTLKIMAALNNKGGLAGQLNDLTTEQRMYEEAISIAPEGSIQKAQIAGNMALSFYYSGKLGKASRYIEMADQLAGKNGFVRGQQQACYLKGQIAERKGNFKEALSCFKAYLEFTNQLIDENTSKRITQIQLNNDFNQQMKLDSLHRAQELAQIKMENSRNEMLRAEQLKKRNQLVVVVVIVLVMVIYVAFRFFKIGKEREQANETITAQKVEVEEQRDLAKKRFEEAEKQKALVEEKNKEITHSINYARRLQHAILPPEDEVQTLFPGSFVLYIPKDIVAGDFYWMEQNESDANWVFFSVADCTGHGVPGAMVSVVCANALNRSIKEFRLTRPNEILDKTSALVEEAFEKGGERILDGMDAVLCAFNFQTKELLYAGAFNPLWIVSATEKLNTNSQYQTIALGWSDNFLHEIKANKQPVGKYDKRVPYSIHSVQLEKGDWIYLSTDGFADQFGGPKKKKYKSLNFKKLLLSLSNNSGTKQAEKLNQEIHTWSEGIPQVDDICVMGIRV